MRKKIVLLAALALVFILPLIGSLARWGGLPPEYGKFPSPLSLPMPGFSKTFFIGASAIALAITLFLAFPRLFGFKKIESAEPKPAQVPYPAWFWWNLPVLGLSWLLMWAPIPFLSAIRAYAFVPLWWSFIFILDGIAHKRSGGASLMSRKPLTLQLIAVVSCFGWFGFEYLNYFTMENWYYPNNEIFSNFGNAVWFSVSYTTILPAVFEWYLLLRTFPFFQNRYGAGPRISIPKKALGVLFALGAVLALGMGYYPYQLFWVMWLALVPMLAGAMGMLGLKTPLSSIKNGNWTPAALTALAAAFNGFFWELWNYGSEAFNGGAHTNPNYWKYAIPYLDNIHIFSEMPLLGYYGYLFFGINCWILWLAAAHIFGFDSEFQTGEEPNQQ